MGDDKSWIIGVCLNLVGSISINLGTNLMKLGHNRRAEAMAQGKLERTRLMKRATRAGKKNGVSDSELEMATFDLAESPAGSYDAPRDGNKAPETAVELGPAPAQQSPIWKSPVWLVGTSLFIGGNALNFVSFGFAAQSMLAALGAVQFVSNVVFARFVLKEKITWRVLAATALIVAACLLLVLFGSHVSVALTAEMAVQLYHNTAYIVYLCCVAVVAPLAFLLYTYGTHLEKRGSKLTVTGRAARGKAHLRSALIQMRPIAFATFAALIGTQSVLFGKTVSELIQATVSGTNQFTYWYTYIAFLLLPITAVFWMFHLNKGLRLFPAVIIVPTLQIFWTLFSIICGGIYFDEFSTFTPLATGMFALGVLLIFAGVLLLTSPPGPKGAEVAPASAVVITTAIPVHEVEGSDTPRVIPRKHIGREGLRDGARVVKSLDSNPFAKYPSLLYEGSAPAWRSVFVDEAAQADSMGYYNMWSMPVASVVPSAAAGGDSADDGSDVSDGSQESVAGPGVEAEGDAVNGEC